jgi:hypothetical protein
MCERQRTLIPSVGGIFFLLFTGFLKVSRMLEEKTKQKDTENTRPTEGLFASAHVFARSLLSERSEGWLPGVNAGRL